MPHRSRSTAALGLVLLCCTALPASAQLFSAREGRAFQSVSFGYYLIDFQFDGDAEPLFSFDFTEPAYGLVYTRPRFLATFGAGDQGATGTQERLRLLDASLITWGPLLRKTLGEETGRVVYVPIVLFSHYRRVAPRGSGSLVDAFSVTVLGLGTGAGLNLPVGRRALIEARISPVIGLATSSFTDALGHARLVDADVQLHVGRVFGRMGLSVGYNARAQVWNVGASDLFPDFTDDLFDYRGTQHLVRVGVNW